MTAVQSGGRITAALIQTKEHTDTQLNRVEVSHNQGLIRIGLLFFGFSDSSPKICTKQTFQRQQLKGISKTCSCKIAYYNTRDSTSIVLQMRHESEKLFSIPYSCYEQL